jgi:hypothetical protein
MNHDKVLFVHIPKTGGRSIVDFLNRNNLDQWVRNPRLTNHDTIFNLANNNDLSNTFIFSVVRNPFTRAFSHYNHILDRRREAGKHDITFNEFLKYARSRGNLIFMDSHLEYMPFLINSSQAFYLHDDTGTMSLINKIYKFENLKEFENDFNTVLPKLNVGKYTFQDYLEAYTKDNINLVRQVYLEDFISFNYSNNFDDSIK